ncbi:MAG: hypothetical protein MJ221_04240 [Bacilli bacterium]|nr:hypothetical protein [Bacilli bacterium]
MKELELANKVLTSVLKDNVSFKKSLREVFNDVSLKDKQYASIVSLLVGCELRHHLMFLEILKDKTKDIDDELKNIVLLAMANNLFAKKLDKNDVNNFVKLSLCDKYNDEIDKILNYEGSIGDLINLDKSSLEYISLRFNTPKYLSKMWIKHFGKGPTLKTMKANGLPFKNYVRENTLYPHCAILDDETKFTKIDDAMYLYKGKELRKFHEYQEDKIIPLNPSIKHLLDKYINPLSDEITMFSGENDNLVKEMHIRLGKNKGLNLAVPSKESRPEIRRYIRVNKIKNINFWDAEEYIGFKCGISLPQDFILVNPKSSGFDNVSRFPDYLLRFDKNSLDELISKQKAILNDLSKFVAPNGLLVYLVNTLNRKETFSIISSFIIEHSNFDLIDERQIFPYEDENASIYYAVLKAKEDSND